MALASQWAMLRRARARSKVASVAPLTASLQPSEGTNCCLKMHTKTDIPILQLCYEMIGSFKYKFIESRHFFRVLGWVLWHCFYVHICAFHVDAHSGEMLCKRTLAHGLASSEKGRHGKRACSRVGQHSIAMICRSSIKSQRFYTV